MTERIGFVGVGIMGRPMVANLVKAGFPVTVFDLVPAAVEALENEGVPAAASSREVAEASDVVITMLPEDPHVEAAILATAREYGVALPVTALVNEMFTTLVSEGRAERPGWKLQLLHERARRQRRPEGPGSRDHGRPPGFRAVGLVAAPRRPSRAAQQREHRGR